MPWNRAVDVSTNSITDGRTQQEGTPKFRPEDHGVPHAQVRPRELAERFAPTSLLRGFAVLTMARCPRRPAAARKANAGSSQALVTIRFWHGTPSGAKQRRTYKAQK